MVATPIVVKILFPANSIPAIAVRTVTPEISTAWPDVAAVRRSDSCGVLPERSLLALALQVEERVVDADRHADHEDHRCRSVERVHELAHERVSPVAASTAEKASSTGRPAATSDPNATRRMRRVSGSDVNSLRLMSSLNAFDGS